MSEQLEPQADPVPVPDPQAPDQSEGPVAPTTDDAPGNPHDPAGDLEQVGGGGG